MRGRSIRGTVAAVVCGTILIAAGFTAVAPSASACSCAVPDLHESLAEAHEVFIGRQIDARDRSDDHGRILTFEVSEWFKGDEGDTFEVATGYGGGDCGIDLGYSDEEFGIITWRGPDQEMSSVGLCGSVWPAQDVRYAFEPLPSPEGAGTPAFLAPMRSGGAYAMLLDAEGATLAYAMGERDLASAAFCPGHETLIELWTHHDWRTPDGFTAGFTVRSLPGMQIVAEHDIDFLSASGSHPEEERIAGLACHATNGSVFSYAHSRYRYDDWPAAWIPDSSSFHFVEDGSTTTVDIGDARVHLAIPEADLLVAIRGDSGQEIASWTLHSLAVAGATQLPGTDVGWGITYDGTNLAIASRDWPLEDFNVYYPEVNQVRYLDLDLNDLGTVPLPHEGALRQHVAVDNEAWLTVTVNDQEGTPIGTFLIVVAQGTAPTETLVNAPGDGGMVYLSATSASRILYRPADAWRTRISDIGSPDTFAELPLVTNGPLVGLNTPLGSTQAVEPTTTSTEPPATTTTSTTTPPTTTTSHPEEAGGPRFPPVLPLALAVVAVAGIAYLGRRFFWH